MERLFQVQLEEIKSLLLTMGGCVELALESVTSGLIDRDLKKLEAVTAIEKQINESHLKLDESITRYIAKHGPVASDLRFVISSLKINSDLERMGDQCVNISHSGRDYISRPQNFKTDDIKRMAQVARKMVKSSLDAFVGGDVALAKEVLLTDDELDALKNQVFQKMIEEIKRSPSDTEAALDLILIARNLERMGDHATNIAEDVIYFSTGKDVRHGKFG